MMRSGIIGRFGLSVLTLLFVMSISNGVMAMGKLNKNAPTAEQAKPDGPKPHASGLPKLVDLGAKKCIPCKMMEPILEELKKDYEGKLSVEFIDVWQQPDAGERYGIRMIPTQIFYASDGRELFRHQGFISKEDILETWKKYGVELSE